MLTIKFFFLVIFIGIVEAQHKWKCVKSDEAEVDNITSLLFTLGRKDRKFPEAVGDLKDYCK